MDFDHLYGVPDWLIQLVFVALLVGAVEVGYRRGRRLAPTSGEKAKAQIAVIEGSLIAVLGLLLAFTMSMAVGRFEIRKQLVLEEANAIGTSWLRAQVLPAPESTDIASLLRDYVDVRLKFVKAGGDVDQILACRKDEARLQAEFWTRAVACARSDPTPVTALLLQSLNNAIDLEAARWMALQNHVPSAVIYVNAIIGLLSAMLVGYAFGLDGVRHLLSVCLLGIAITAVLGLIIDLDRPRDGLIQVSQQPMIDLQEWLHSPHAVLLQSSSTTRVFLHSDVARQRVHADASK